LGGGSISSDISAQSREKSTPTVYTTPDWRQLKESHTTLINSALTTDRDTIYWTPHPGLDYRHTPHPLIDNIDPQITTHLRELCQQCPNGPILKCNTINNLIIDTEHLRDLMSYNCMVNDQIMTLYAEMLSNKYEVTHMATAFFPRLLQQGWRNVQHYFANTHPRYRPRTPHRPCISGEPCILIPAFINECHWVAITRREIHNKVIFLYCDDMNNTNTEADIKHFLKHNTSQEFYPPTTIWINCKSTCYFPHSNECGPRTLLALHMMAIHPNPHSDMLLPIMHSNLAQIARTWISSALITGNLIDDSLHHYITTTSPAISSLTSQSFPSDLIHWASTSPQILSNTAPTITSEVYADITLTADHPSSQNTRSISSPSISGDKHITEHDLSNSGITKPTPNHLPRSSSKSQTTLVKWIHNDAANTRLHSPPKNNILNEHDENINQTTETTSSSNKETQNRGDETLRTDIHQPNPVRCRQASLHRWTINRIEGVPKKPETSEIKDDIIPYGTTFPSIDPTTTLRIIMQNTQYSMQLTQDDEKTLQTIANLKSLEASIFTAISPNINWNNASNVVAFKRKFNHAYNQVHIPWFHLVSL
jgi:hypothetical protein